MAVRPPIVLGTDNLYQQLQSGDSISAPMTTTNIRPVANAETSAAMPFGTPVYTSGADTVKRAQANAKATAKVAGLVFDPSIAAGANGNIASGGVLIASTAAQWDAVNTGGSGGLVPNTTYFLDPANVGKITAAPAFTNGSGQCNTVLGTAISTLEMELSIGLPILL